MRKALPPIAPMRLSRAKEPFDSPHWLFELKHDGFRGLAYLEDGRCRLLSRNGHEFRGFGSLCDGIASCLKAQNAIIDGEICCLGMDGRSLFNALMFRRSLPHFYAFDLLWLNGRDLRQFPLVKRKAMLKRILPKCPAPILFSSHVAGTGIDLFRAACEMDLEGIVAKRKDSIYDGEQERSADWVKIKNKAYSQVKGRRELFEARSPKRS